MAPRPLVEREQVHVVVDPDRRVVALLEAASHVEPVPAGHDGRRDGAAGSRSRRARERPPTTPQTGTSGVRASTSSIMAIAASSVSAGPRAMSHARCSCSRMSPSSIGHADVDVQSAQGAHDDAAAVAAEAQGPRGAAAGRGAELAVLEVPHLDRLIDALGDHAAAEPGDPADLGTCRRLSGAHHVDDAQQARHFIRLCAEPQRGLLCHGRFLHNCMPFQVDSENL